MHKSGARNFTVRPWFVNEGTIARSLLTTALDEADPDPRNVTELLNRIPAAFERAEQGLAQIRDGEGKDLSEL